MKPKFKTLSIILLIITFLLIASLGFPILIDLVLILIIALLTKLNLKILINLNMMLMIATFIGNFLLIKNFNEDSFYYRAHEKFFINKKKNYIKNINYKTLMPHDDLGAMDVCNNFLDIAAPRNQLFITAYFMLSHYIHYYFRINVSSNCNNLRCHN